MNTKKVVFYRHKVLLALLQSFGGNLSNIDLQKYLFLFTEQCQQGGQQEKSYRFVPFKYGCFSFQSYADRNKLIALGAISSNLDEWQLLSGQDYLAMLSQQDRQAMEQFSNKYEKKKGKRLLKEVYTQYPYYAIRSELAETLLSPAEMAQVESVRPSQKASRFFTIGYEGKSFEDYLNQLIQHNVHVLVDVRKNPLSRKYGFSKTVLSQTLRSLDIAYLHLPELGIVSEQRQTLKTRVDYERLFDSYERTTLRKQQAALQQLVDVMKQHKRVAITCFEAEECMCHRGRVAKALAALPNWKYKIEHL